MRKNVFVQSPLLCSLSSEWIWFCLHVEVDWLPASEVTQCLLRFEHARSSSSADHIIHVNHHGIGWDQGRWAPTHLSSTFDWA